MMDKIVVNQNIIYGLIDPNTKLLRYIGYTSDKEARYFNHHAPSCLKKKSHKNNWIKSLIKNDQKAEMIIIAEYETAEELPAAEEYWYAFFISNGADLTNDPDFIGEGCKKGKVASEETRQKMSNAHKGKPRSEATKKKISASLSGANNPKFGKYGKDAPHFGHSHSEETKIKISVAKKGSIGPMKNKKHTEETKKKMSASQKGRITSEETKKKISIAHTGTKRSIQSRENMSKATKGKSKSEQHKQNISKAKKGKPSPLKGRKLSEETKKKISEANQKLIRR